MTETKEKRYRERFDDALLAHVEDHILTHIFGFSTADSGTRAARLGQARPSSILETILAAARQVADGDGDPDSGALRRLILVSLAENLPLAAVEAISAFLQAFAEAGNTRVRDYLATMQALDAVGTMDDGLLTGVQHASQLHRAQGRLVYGLLATAHQLVVAAQATLKHDPAYMAEKLLRARRYMQTANETAREYQPQRFQNEAG